MTVAPQQVDLPAANESYEVDRAWQVVVWNDPVNLMSYVVWVFRKLFGHNLEKATQPDAAGAQRGTGDRKQRTSRKAESDCHRLHHHGLWATLERI